MKATRSVIAATGVVVAFCVALVPAVGGSEPMGQRMKRVPSSQPAPNERSGLEAALSSATNPRLHDRAAIQPLVGPVKSVKAPNLQKNLSALGGKVKNLATGAYCAAKKAGPFVGSVAIAAAQGLAGGAGFKYGAKLAGRLK